MKVWWFVRRPSYHGVKCLLRDGERLLLVRHSYGEREFWELPGGRVKRGEDPLASAHREIEEELGLRVDRWDALGTFEADADFKHETIHCFAAQRPEGTIVLADGEIAEAEWVDPQAPPGPVGTITRLVLALPGAASGTGARAR